MNNIEVLSSTELRLRDGAIAPLFRKYAIPGVVALLFVGIQSIIDGLVVGNFIGASALASVSIIFPIYSFMIAIAIMLGVGCQALISIRLGENNRQGANNAFRSAFMFIAFFSVAISVLIFLFIEDFVILLGADEILLANSVAYLKSMILFFPFILIMMFCDYIAKSIGHPIYAMITMSATVTINIILNLVFVIVYDMGTFGAGLATGLAFLVGAAVNIPLVLKRDDVISIKKGKFSWRLVGQIAYNGSSEGVTELSTGITTLLFNLVLMHHLGGDGVAAFTAINYVYFISITIFLGVSDGIIPIISYNHGANQHKRVKKTLFLAARTNFVIGCFIFMMLSFFGESIISLFFKVEDSEVLKIALHAISIYSFAFLINGFNILTASYFTAMGNAKISIIISALRGLIFAVMGICLLPELFGIDGIWYTIPLAELLTLFVSIYLVYCYLMRPTDRSESNVR